MNKPTMLYDGECPLCRREVNHYIAIDKQQRVEWVNIHEHPERLRELNLNLAAAMARLHAIDADGQLVRGVPAFMVVWTQLPFYRVLPPIIRFFRVESLLDKAYGRFADWRYKNRCGDSCLPPSS